MFRKEKETGNTPNPISFSLVPREKNTKKFHDLTFHDLAQVSTWTKKKVYTVWCQRKVKYRTVAEI